MPRGYGSHADYMLWVKSDADYRQAILEEAHRRAFSDSIERRNVDVIVFSGMTAASFAQAIFSGSSGNRVGSWKDVGGSQESPLLCKEGVGR